MAEASQTPFQAPACDVCGKDAVVEQAYSGRILCGYHLEKSIRKKVAKELRKQLHLNKEKSTTVFVAISGGKDSAVLLTLLVELIGMRRDVRIVAGCVDEGIAGYRPPSMQCAIDLCETLGVEFISTSYENLDFHQMDEVVQRLPIISETKDGVSMMPCSYCGVFRRQGINALARQVGADVVALGHNLDDMAQTVLMNMTNGDIDRTLRLAPHTDSPVDGLPPRIVPLRWIPEQEIHLLAMHKELPLHHEECPYAQGALRWRYRDIVAQLEQDVPGTRHSLVRMSDNIKQVARQETPTIQSHPTKCGRCGSPTSGSTCKACDMRDLLDVDLE
ncbi:MAG: TIGR00269 family protein [Candidatus Poseidoniaceae archaeon]